MSNLDNIPTHEMNQEQWSEFRRQWIEGYAKSLVIECDMSREDAAEIADIRFEDYVGQEGYTARDLAITEARNES